MTDEQEVYLRVYGFDESIGVPIWPLLDTRCLEESMEASTGIYTGTSRMPFPRGLWKEYCVCDVLCIIGVGQVSFRLLPNRDSALA